MQQVLIGGVFGLLHAVNTQYSLISGGIAWTTTKDVRAQTISTSGKLKNLRVKLNDTPGGGTKTYTFTLHRAVGTGAWANTALTCTVASGATQASDTVNEVSVAAGDVVTLECDPTDTPTARYATWTMVFQGDTANESLLLLTLPLSTADTRYANLQGYGYDVVENDMRCVCPTSGTIKNLYVQLQVDPGTAPDAHKFTLRIGGVSQALTVTITADNRTGNDTGNDIAVSAGDILTLITEPLNTPSSSGTAAVGMTFVADTDGESLILSGSQDDLDNTATEYSYLISNHTTTWTTTEAERYQLGQACTLKKLYVLLSGTPGAGNKYTLTVRIAGASSNVVAEVADTATTGNSGALEDTVANDNYVGLQVVPTSTPTVRDAYWGLVSYIVPPVAQAVGSGAVAIAGTLSSVFRFVQSVGGGSIAIAGLLGRFIKISVGAGSIAIAGALGRVLKIAVGDGSIAIAGSLGRKIKIAVGGGAVAMAGTLIAISEWIALTLRGLRGGRGLGLTLHKRILSMTLPRRK